MKNNSADSNTDLGLPVALLGSLEGIPGFDREAFEQVHAAGNAPVSVRYNPLKVKTIEGLFPAADRVPWSRLGYYLPERPVFALDPNWHAGAYYVQEASSLYIEKALELVKLPPSAVVCDLCAAPGGKSTHLLSLIPADAVLVSNEVIQGRQAILQENLVRWGAPNLLITQSDPSDFGRLGPVFDLLLVDAPCSGSGLFRREPEAVQEWSPAAVALCCRRQQRILADAWPALKPGGYLLYATCSYSPEEDEDIVRWLMASLGAEVVPLSADIDHGVVAAMDGSLRFFPHRVRGEGFFLALLKKPGELQPGLPGRTGRRALEVPAALQPMLKPGNGLVAHAHADRWYLMPPLAFDLFHRWQKPLRIRRAGILAATEVRGQFNPEHPLALASVLDTNSLRTIDADIEMALSYLRLDSAFMPEGEPGWYLVTYQGRGLGWIKHLGRRVNNYLPREWRLRMR